jgi:hypothetical protein
MNKANAQLTQDDFKNLMNQLSGYTGSNNQPLDQFEWVILQGLNSDKSFVKDRAYDLKAVGKGFKNGSIELIRDTRKSKIFVSSFHVDRQNGTNKVTNVTVYTFEHKKQKDTRDSKWEFVSKIKVTNDSEYNYPLKKLHKYIETQLQLDGEQILSRYTKIVEGSSPEELEAYTSLVEQVKNLRDKYKVTELLRNIFENNETKELTDYLLENDLLADDLKSVVEYRSRVAAVREFIAMLNSTLEEKDWQKWFEENSWVLGSDFVRIVDERRIDVANISDYLVEAYDGFLDLIEIKKPSPTIKFWSESKDHDNYFPHSDLVKAITQSMNYINQIEKKIDSKEFQKQVDNVSVIKPRCTLIFGRSISWDEEQKEAYRILNCYYHNLTIITYDHVLERAKRMLGNNIAWDTLDNEPALRDDVFLDPDDLPF